MRVLLISGSTREEGSNMRFLVGFEQQALSSTKIVCEHALNLGLLPLFTPERLKEAAEAPEEYRVVKKFKDQVQQADFIVIATPEYAHNMPAALKNAFEWCVASGEFSRKRVIAMTVTPHEPRGERCMKSMRWTLNALDASVQVEVPIYDVASKVSRSGIFEDEELIETVKVCFELMSAAL